MAVKRQERRDTAANWTSANPVLSSGEIGFETDTKNIKIGDGTTAWTSLGYMDTGAKGLQAILTTEGDTVYASSANTPARLAKGTAGQVIRMNSGATAPEWADAQHDNNYIINGNFDVWQRGTTFSLVDNASAYTADRFKCQTLYSGATVYVDRVTVTDLSGSRYGLRLYANTTPVTGGRITYNYTLDNLDALKLAGKVMTVSLKAKSKQGMNSLGIYAKYNTTNISVMQTTGTAISNASVSINTSTWTDLKLTFTVPSAATLTSTGNFGFNILMNHFGDAGEVAGDGVIITQVKLEIGSDATEFIPNEVPFELFRCMRYYEKSYSYDTVAGTATGAGMWETVALSGWVVYSPGFRYIVPKRVPVGPTMYSTQDGAANQFAEFNSSTVFVSNRAATGRSAANYGSSTTGFSVQSSNGAMTPGNLIWFQWVADAEI